MYFSFIIFFIFHLELKWFETKAKTILESPMSTLNTGFEYNWNNLPELIN